MAQADLFFPDRQSLFRKQHPENLLYFLMRSLLIFNFVKHIVSSFRMTLIPQGYGCRISHSRIYLISTTHSFLISYLFFCPLILILNPTLSRSASLLFNFRFRKSLIFLSFLHRCLNLTQPFRISFFQFLLCLQ